ncbi:MAG TPA: hypothetical protein VFO78_08740, partial [Candidatus Limnocylindrales bacterium]|nr:hypothetical protein [Candidatus Limnocylindrales bacterium]
MERSEPTPRTRRRGVRPSTGPGPTGSPPGSPPGRRTVDGDANARWRALLEGDGPILADGAMGTMLFAAGLQFGDPPEVWNLSQPEVVRRIH